MSIVFEPARNAASRFQFPTPKRALGEDVSFYFPGDLCLRIIHHLIGGDYKDSSQTVANLCLLSRNWACFLSSSDSIELKSMLIDSFVFNKAQWEYYIGAVGKEPPLPGNIHEILQSQCPIWPGKTIAQTHILTLIPKTVNGEPVTLKTLGELVQKPKRGRATKYSGFYSGGYENTPVSESHWVLMARDVIPNSRKFYTDQKQLTQTYNKKGIRLHGCAFITGRWFGCEL